jgi:hypothetical protein
MKGGKAGRKRGSSGGDTTRQGPKPGKPHRGSVKRVESDRPKKGSRKKSYGGTSSSGEE